MRPFIISIAVHAVIISFIWVGFSVSKGSSQKAFTYLGERVELGGAYKRPSDAGVSDALDVNVYQGAGRDPAGSWLKTRELNKPR